MKLGEAQIPVTFKPDKKGMKDMANGLASIGAAAVRSMGGMMGSVAKHGSNFLNLASQATDAMMKNMTEALAGADFADTIADLQEQFGIKDKRKTIALFRTMSGLGMNAQTMGLMATKVAEAVRTGTVSFKGKAPTDILDQILSVQAQGRKLKEAGDERGYQELMSSVFGAKAWGKIAPDLMGLSTDELRATFQENMKKTSDAEVASIEAAADAQAKAQGQVFENSLQKVAMLNEKGMLTALPEAVRVSDASARQLISSSSGKAMLESVRAAQAVEGAKGAAIGTATELATALATGDTGKAVEVGAAMLDTSKQWLAEKMQKRAIAKEQKKQRKAAEAQARQSKLPDKRGAK